MPRLRPSPPHTPARTLSSLLRRRPRSWSSTCSELAPGDEPVRWVSCSMPLWSAAAGGASIGDDPDRALSRPSAARTRDGGDHLWCRASRTREDRPVRATPADPAAPKLVRAADRRLLSGVAAGLADHLGLNVLHVRLAFVVLTAVVGFGLVFYGARWVFVPAQSPNGDPAG